MNCNFVAFSGGFAIVLIAIFEMSSPKIVRAFTVKAGGERVAVEPTPEHYDRAMEILNDVRISARVCAGTASVWCRRRGDRGRGRFLKPG